MSTNVLLSALLLFFLMIIPKSSLTSSESTPIRINCGSTQDVTINGITWESDRNWNAAKDQTWSTRATVNINQPLHEIQRTFWRTGFMYTFQLDTYSVYTINLYFSENFKQSRNARLFNVYINNQQVASRFDIYDEAQGSRIQLIKTYQVLLTTPFVIEIDFEPIPGASWPVVSAIEILSQSDQPTDPTDPGDEDDDTSDNDDDDDDGDDDDDDNNEYPPMTGIFIICGTDKDYTDANNVVWVSDVPYLISENTKSWKTSNNIDNTIHDDIFQSERYIENGNLVYLIPTNSLNNGLYNIQLLFAEIYFNDIKERVFDIKIQGNIVESKLDIYRDAGHDAALVLEYTNIPLGGNIDLTIELIKDINYPKISGIAILPSGDDNSDPYPQPPSPKSTPNPTPNPTPDPTPKQTPKPTPYQPSDPYWSTLKEFPYKIGEISCVAVDNSGYYVFGGQLDNGGPNMNIHKYIISSNEWKELPNNQVPKEATGDHQTQQSYKEYIYTFGGSNSEFSHVMKRYNTKTNIWEFLAPLYDINGNEYGPLSPSSALINNKIYIAGGIIGVETVDKLFEYNIDTNKWNEKKSMPDNGRNHAAGIGYNGLFYIFGGRQGGNYANWGFKESFVYDPKKDEWNRLKDMPIGSGGNGQAVEINGKLLVIGGETCCDSMSDVMVYNIDKNNWEKEDDMITGRHGIAPVVVNNNVYVVGGGIDAGFSQSNVHEVLHF